MKSHQLKSTLRQIGREIYKAGRQVFRNWLALILRLRHAVRLGDEESIINASMNLIEESICFFLGGCTLICLVLGFFRPYLFIMAVALLFVSAIVRQNITDRNKQFLGR